MNAERMSGVLLHVTSLPSYGGVGDFGPAAYGFVDFLAAAKQRLWQVLAAEPDGLWKLALLGAVGVCGQSAADQPGAAGREGWLDCGRSGSQGCRGMKARATLAQPSREDSADRRGGGELSGSRCRTSASAVPDVLPGQHQRGCRTMRCSTCCGAGLATLSWNEWPRRVCAAQPRRADARC